MAAVSPGERSLVAVQTALLLFLYLFLHFPILYIAYLSFMENSVWPFPPILTWEWYERLGIMSDFHVGLWNSLLIGLGSAVLSALFATAAAIGVLRYPVRQRGLMAALYLAPRLRSRDHESHDAPPLELQDDHGAGSALPARVSLRSRKCG